MGGWLESWDRGESRRRDTGLNCSHLLPTALPCVFPVKEQETTIVLNWKQHFILGRNRNLYYSLLQINSRSLVILTAQENTFYSCLGLYPVYIHESDMYKYTCQRVTSKCYKNVITVNKRGPVKLNVTFEYVHDEIVFLVYL